MTVSVRSYQAKDVDAIVSLILEIQQNEFAIPITRAMQPDLDNIPEFYQQGQGNFWVATDEEKIVGTIALVDIGEGEAALRKMFVSSHYRGKSFGTAKHLLDTLIAWSETKKLKTIYLGTTDKFKAAHRFYEKNDFVLVDKADLPTSFPVMSVDTRFYKRTI